MKLVPVQYLRFFAAFLVLVGHVLMDLHQHDLISDAFYATLDTFPWGGGVDIFFVISGFIICRTLYGQEPGGRSVANFALRRIARIAPAYWIFTTLMLVATAVFANQIRAPGSGLPHIVASYLFIPYPDPSGVLRPVLAQGWTLNYEMTFYLAAGLSLLLAEKLRAFFVVFAIVFLMILSNAFPADSVFARFFGYSVLLEFLYGVGISLVTSRLLLMGVGIRVVLLVVGLVGLSLAGLVTEYPRGLVQGIPAMLIVASAIMDVGPATRKRISPLEVLGDASYALYLIHPFVVNATIIFATRLFHPKALALFLLCLPASIVAAVIFHLLIERKLTFGLTSIFKSALNRGYPAKPLKSST